MSTRMIAVETTQAEFKNQLSELMLTSHNNEAALKSQSMQLDNLTTMLTSQNNDEALKSCYMQLDNLATMVTSIMNKLEFKSMMSPPNHSGANLHQVPRSPPKSTCETIAQSIPSRVAASSANPIDVVDVSYVPSEDENPPKHYVRVTRSKDVKEKGVSGATGNSEVGTKVGRSEKATKKRKVTRGGGSKGRGTEEGSTQQVSVEGGIAGEEVDVGGDTEKAQEVVSGVEGIVESGGVTEGGGAGQTARGESDIVGGPELGVIAEESTPALSPGKGSSAFAIHVRSKNKSPSKLGGNGGENIARGGEVSPSIWPQSPSIPEAYKPTKLLIFNVHGTLLDTSLLTEPNPNPVIRVTKKTKTRRFVYRPWMIEFLRRCFQFFKVAFWGQKSSGYMDEILQEIMPMFEHMEGRQPLFAWSSKDCEIIHKTEDVTIWGKPLTKVWKKWPCWNATNTIIVDHHAPRVGCNPQVNVIVPPSFYVANIQDVSEDNDYLKVKLWPALGGLNVHHDVATFWCALNATGEHAGLCEVNTSSRSILPRHPCTPFADPRVPKSAPRKDLSSRL